MTKMSVECHLIRLIADGNNIREPRVSTLRAISLSNEKGWINDAVKQRTVDPSIR